jgi:hypothetical protein
MHKFVLKEEIILIFRLSSAYTSAFGGIEPKYTTWKIREDGEHKQILDYIFHSKDRLQVKFYLRNELQEITCKKTTLK